MSSIVTRFAAHPLWALGFRPFFLLSALAGAGLMLLWALVWQGAVVLPARLPSSYWHGHEMVYGYGLAVVAGFLLTAVRNWTGQPTPSGAPLAMLALLWLLPRLLLPLALIPVPLVALCDLAFALLLLVAIGRPIHVAGQLRRQSGVLLSVTALWLLNLAFYGEVLGWLQWGYRVSLYGGLYALLYLVLLVGRRIMPMFTERGVGYAVTLRNNDKVDRLCSLSLLLFAVADVLQLGLVVNGLALLAAGVHGWRWWGWQTRGTYTRPLLWALHVGYALVVAGFVVSAANVAQQWASSVVYHLFALGGVALITFGMMARVALGHTGRNIHQPPQAVTWLFGLILCALVARVVLPLLLPGSYSLWIVLAQISWVAGCSLFVWLYWPILMKPRPDGTPG